MIIKKNSSKKKKKKITKVQIIKQLVSRNERDQLRMLVVRENVRRKWNKKVCLRTSSRRRGREGTETEREPRS